MLCHIVRILSHIVAQQRCLPAWEERRHKGGPARGLPQYPLFDFILIGETVGLIGSVYEIHIVLKGLIQVC